MTQVLFSKIAAGPSFGPYVPGDVADINATDLARMTGPTEPNGIGSVAATQITASHPLWNKFTKKGT
jgi:hypothetical protein